MTSKSNQTNKPLDKKNKPQSSSIWGGRFEEKPHEIMDQINPSIDFDKRFFRQDIRGSKAHAEMLSVQKIITKIDNDKIIKNIRDVLRTTPDMQRSLSSPQERLSLLQLIL